jgi:hypothetical protein
MKVTSRAERALFLTRVKEAPFIDEMVAKEPGW